MVRKSWETPRAMVEEFEANEYVAVCGGMLGRSMRCRLGERLGMAARRL